MNFYNKTFYTRLKWLLGLFFLSSFSFVWAISYSSKFLTQNSEESIKTYYFKHLNNLTKSLKPRVIHYIDSDNYNKYKKIYVTGILFMHSAPEAHKISFICDLDNFKPRMMTRNKKGIWYYILSPKSYLSQRKLQKVRYKFLVDGAYENDINGIVESDFSGGSNSVYYLYDSIAKPTYGTTIIKKRNLYTREVIFRIKLKDAEQVSLIGNFNNWDNSIDIMKKISDNIFEITKRLPKGKYTYLFYSSGDRYVDDVNPEKRKHSVFGPVSYIKVN